ncbi:flagellar export protein FliJ [Enterovibrio nigricans]|uniref:Flagellar FliJ protein n=1 Tax=Enterovibrio nigricans DSM 22720 TaxID=1121868 RepID=A0A1T4UJP7_9GAMM|nr:flagellar export protein FliJ [Enterovibrio nigricans]PKF48724.1 flagellar export protein FliJ [Enterovibrio nigricans]SKA52955.1 flagellar export protein FliJ [Enterovibrio nigricans DSM 22720]
MDAKIKACGKLQRVEEKRRDTVGAKLDAMRQKHAHIQTKLGQLGELKDQRSNAANGTPALTSTALMNLTHVDLMLQKMLTHCEQEQAVLQAQCNAVKKELEHRHSRVLGLEKAMERWTQRQNYENAKREQRLLEELINARVKRRR